MQAELVKGRIGSDSLREIEHAAIVLPPRERHEEYVRQPVPQVIVVADID